MGGDKNVCSIISENIFHQADAMIEISHECEGYQVLLCGKEREPPRRMKTQDVLGHRKNEKFRQ